MNVRDAWWLTNHRAPLTLGPFRGAFCIPGALPSIPYGDGNRVWDPALACYSGFHADDWSWFDRILEAHLNRGHNSVEYSLAGMPYRNDYPEIEDDPDRAAADLQRIEAFGLIPLVCVCDDRKGGLLPVSASVCAPLIRRYFPMYEQNGPLPSEDAQKRLIADCRHAIPNGEPWLHFTPKHGSISSDEIAGWQWCAEIGVKGLLSQDNEFRDPVTAGIGLQGTALRLAGQYPGWENLVGYDLKDCAFEQTTTLTYNHQMTEAEQIAYTVTMLAECPAAYGWHDGGPRS